MQSSTRRGLLQRGLVLLGGAIGIGAAANVAAAVPAPAGRQLTLYGRGFHQHQPGKRAGTVPERGDRSTTYGELVDANGSKIGEFTGAFMALAMPFGDNAFAASSMELHSFRLTDGTITGFGTTDAGGGSFVITGGTGKYAGAKGSYLARQRTRNLGGDGTAEFHLTIDLAA